MHHTRREKDKDCVAPVFLAPPVENIYLNIYLNKKRKKHTQPIFSRIIQLMCYFDQANTEFKPPLPLTHTKNIYALKN